MTTVQLLRHSLILMIGLPGIGANRFALRHFPEDAVFAFADEAALRASLPTIHKRLRTGKLVVIGGTNLTPANRIRWVKLGHKYHAHCAAIILDATHKEWKPRFIKNGEIEEAIWKKFKNKHRRIYSQLAEIRKEKFHKVHYLNSQELIDSAKVEFVTLQCDKREEKGPFDIIGDVHGCLEELVQLLQDLGYQADANGKTMHPDGRKLVFLGDLVDRGPNSLRVLRMVRRMVLEGRAFLVLGNHDWAFLRYLRDGECIDYEGFETTLAELNRYPEQKRELLKSELARFLRKTGTHYVFDEGKLVVAHAGLPEVLHGSPSSAARGHALFGTPDSSIPDSWVMQYGGDAFVVYGHSPTTGLQIRNNTLNIDTGCVYGGALTAFRYPESEFKCVRARKRYSTVTEHADDSADHWPEPKAQPVG